jgi:hypothetical protein
MLFKECIDEVVAVTGLNATAAEEMARFSNDAVGGYNLGFILQKIQDAKVRLLIQEGEEEEKRLCRESPVWCRR